MANNRMTEGVGKKIVEALKMQSDVEITPLNETETFELPDEITTEAPSIVEDSPLPEEEFHFEEDTAEDFSSFNEQPAIQKINLNTPPQTFIHPELDDFEVPSNVAVLKQLISKLPAGVTKQTGAVIIKQTMEALGISMKSVLQEAQQVQEGLNNSSRECQASIMEYKKQIGILEKQAQKYQRQYAALNDIISLFVQTSI